MKTNRAHGFVLVVTIAVVAACSGSQAEVSYGPDGGVLLDGGTQVDTGHHITTADTGMTVVTPDATSTFIDTGSATTPDTGVVGASDVTTSTGDGGGACPNTCAADSDCASACPATPGAINCCDTVTSACFTSASSACPDTMTSSGGGDSGGGGY